MSGDPPCDHNVIVVLSWRPWRGYRVHEVCVRCGADQAHPGHCWRRTNAERRVKRLLDLAHRERLARIRSFASRP